MERECDRGIEGLRESVIEGQRERGMERESVIEGLMDGERECVRERLRDREITGYRENVIDREFV